MRILSGRDEGVCAAAGWITRTRLQSSNLLSVVAYGIMTDLRCFISLLSDAVWAQASLRITEQLTLCDTIKPVSAWITKDHQGVASTREKNRQRNRLTLPNTACTLRVLWVPE